jgi:epoxyqueuosine reductase QueG
MLTAASAVSKRQRRLTACAGGGRAAMTSEAALAPEAGPETGQGRKTKDVLEAAAKLFLDGPGNGLGPGGERIYAEPIFGYASAGDPLWADIAADIGEDFWRPEAAFERGRPGSGLEAASLSVAVILCPQTEATIADQRRAKGFPAERWIRSRFLHDRIIDPMCDQVAAALAEAGVAAVVPDHLPGFGAKPHPRYQISSQWSHRHAGFVAGLGTFGLCDGLITTVGKAHRLGSLVVAAQLAPTPRAYSGPYDYCLWHNSGRCAKCADRCPAGALTKSGHDKILCQAFLNEVSAPRISAQWPELKGAYGCGLCQSAVPCDTRRPGA